MTYREIPFGYGACRVCGAVRKVTPGQWRPHGKSTPARIRRHGPGGLCPGSGQPPQPWVQAAGLPAWEDMTDLDKGAALLHVWKRDWEGRAYAIENYPAEYRDHPALVGLIPRVACRHAVAVAGPWDAVNIRVGAGEVSRLYDLALAAERAEPVGDHA